MSYSKFLERLENGEITEINEKLIIDELKNKTT